MSFTGVCGVCVSDLYMLNNVGDSTSPCGTPVLIVIVLMFYL